MMLTQTHEIYLQASVSRSPLLNTTFRAEDALGNKIGAGYVDSVQTLPNGECRATIRVLINGEIYGGSLNWDDTRYCMVNALSFREIELR